jgi:hypothetical protein
MVRAIFGIVMGAIGTVFYAFVYWASIAGH